MPRPRLSYRPSVERLEARELASISPLVPAPATGRQWMQQHNSFSRIAQRGKPNVLFVGDSITQRWLYAGRTSWMRYFAPLGSHAFGINGDSTQSLHWRLTHGELAGRKPKAIVIMIGTNNLSTATPADIARGITALTQSIRNRVAGARILVLGILPRGGPDEANLRADIATVNQYLSRLDNRNNRRFLDVGAHFLGPDGVPRADLMPDYLHLSPAGYQVLTSVIRPTVKALLRPPAVPKARPAPAAQPPPSQAPTTSAPKGLYTAVLAPPPNISQSPPQTGLGGSYFV